MAAAPPPPSSPPIFHLDPPADVGVLRSKIIAGCTISPYVQSDWREWLARSARGELAGTAAELPASVRAALDQPVDPAALISKPSYCNSYLGRAATPEEQLEFFALNGFLPSPPSPHEQERLKLVRAYNLDDRRMIDSVTDICELARAFFPEDVTVAAFAVAEHMSLIMGLARAVGDDADWEGTMAAMDASWCLGRHTLATGDGLFVVHDAEQDGRYKANPMFKPGGGARFFAAVPVSLPTASTSDDLPPTMVPVGILSCMSNTPHAELTDAQVTALRMLAKRIERDLALAQEMEQQRRAREQASFLSSFLQITLGGTAVSSEKASASMQAVFGGASRHDTAAFALAAERLCALSSARSAAILDLRDFLPARNGVGPHDELKRQAQGPRVHFRSPASGGIDYDASSHPLDVLGHSGLSDESIRRVSSLGKGDIDGFEALVRRIKAGEVDAVPIEETVLSHLVPPNAQASHLVPILDHTKSLALLIVVSLDEHVDDLTECDATFLTNVGHVCLSALVKDQDVESDRARLAFVSSISHALRLPLHGLAGQLELIRGASMGLDEHLAVADVCVDSLRGLLADAVDYYNMNDPLAVQPAPSAAAPDLVDLPALLQDVTTRALNRSLQDAFDGDEDIPGMPKKNVAVVVDVAARAGGWLARARANDLRRIVGNVVANAYRYTTEGEVRVTLEETGDVVAGQRVVKISVADTGCGIDEAFMRSGQLFMPFRRADAFTPSVGLGLPIVNLLVAQHGGQVHVTSALNEGTTVDILLPLTLIESAPAPALERSLSEEIAVVVRAASSAVHHAPTDPTAAYVQPEPTPTPLRRPPFTRVSTAASHDEPLSCPSSPSSRPELSRTASSASSQDYSSTSSTPSRRRRPLRVLGCEDNLIARKLLAALLKQKGYEFHAAVDGQQGVDAFELHRPDVTVMDIGMPVLDGIQASSQIRRIEAERGWPRHRIIALTGLSNEVDRVASQDLIDGWLLKGGDSLRVLTEQLARLQLELDDRGDLDDDEPDTPISASSSPPYKLDGAPPSFTSL